jgi:hypothetical protein
LTVRHHSAGLVALRRAKRTVTALRIGLSAVRIRGRCAGRRRVVRHGNRLLPGRWSPWGRSAVGCIGLLPATLMTPNAGSGEPRLRGIAWRGARLLLRPSREGSSEAACIRGHRTAQRVYALLRDRRREARAGVEMTSRNRLIRGLRYIRCALSPGRRHRDGRLPRLAWESHRRDPHHGSSQLARHHSGGARRRARRGRPLTKRRRYRGRGGRGGRRGWRRGHARCDARNLRLIHHQHRPLELWRDDALQGEVAFGAGLRRFRVLRTAIRTEHSTTSGRQHSGSRSPQPSSNCLGAPEPAAP